MERRTEGYIKREENENALEGKIVEGAEEELKHLTSVLRLGLILSFNNSSFREIVMHL